MILTEEMILAALRYRTTKLWERFNDGMIFAVSLPDGDTGYCCIMGNGGEHFSLALYRGEKGFSAYLKTVNLSPSAPMELFETSTTFDFVSCDFENVSEGEIRPEAKRLIKETAKKNGLKISRPKGWPSFVRMDHGRNSLGLCNEKDCKDITVALKAAFAVAEKTQKLGLTELIDLGFNPDDEYAPTEGGKVIPLLIPKKDGSYLWEQTATPPLVEDEYPHIIYNDNKTAEKLKKTRHHGILQCRLIHLPAPVGTPEDSFYAQMLLAINKSDGLLLPIMTHDEDNDETIVDRFGALLAESGFCPMTIEVCDDHTEALLEDFCEKTGIRLSRYEHLKTLDNIWSQLFFQFGAQ